MGTRNELGRPQWSVGLSCDDSSMTDIGTFSTERRQIDTRLDSLAARFVDAGPRVRLPRCGDVSPLALARMLIWSSR
jgi:hypothetical protein